VAIYIIEHLEPSVWKWCLIEYQHISNIVGKENLWITNLKHGCKALEPYAKLFKESVRSMSLIKKCVLDMETDKELTPAEAASFNYFIFGGILGDDPPKFRTKKELTQFIGDAAVRHIGPKQMSTDNAVFTVHAIEHGKRLSDLQFQDGIDIPLREGEDMEMPYRYNVVDGKPLVSPALIAYLKRRKEF